MTCSTCLPSPCPGEGHRRKVAALALLAARREAITRRAQRALLVAMLAGDGTATADNVRSVVVLPPGVDPVCLGGTPGPLARAGIIARDGYATTRRPEAHARPVSLWRLRDRAAAIGWLRDHPDLPAQPHNTAPAVAESGGRRQGWLFDAGGQE